MIDFLHSSSVAGAVSIADARPVAMILIKSARREAPVPACGLSKSVIGTGPFIKGRRTGVIIEAIVFVLDPSSLNGKSHIISSIRLAAFLASSIVGFSIIGGRVRSGDGAKYNSDVLSYPGVERIVPSSLIVGVSVIP